MVETPVIESGPKPIRKCERCGGDLPKGARPNRRFCSNYCGQADWKNKNKVVALPWSKKRLWDRTPPIVPTDLNLCYFAALIGGIRLIDDKNRELGLFHVDPITGVVKPDIKPEPLAKYVQTLGDRLAREFGVIK